MCGRYTVYTEAQYEEMRGIVREAGRRLSGGGTVKTGEIFPTDLAAVMTPAGASPMVWGFPRWNGGGVVINARAETAAEKRMFRAAVFSRRLVVPSTGFFEWRRIDGRKQKEKYRLFLPGTPMLYMAGLYNLYRLPDGREAGRFVILTTAANESVAPLHDRMPVILAPEEKEAWFSDGAAAGRILSRPGPALRLEEAP
ncbi:MAG TPA: SOS response-associated peptidase [Oscillospiraceae bacterium]|nr:SOS response-associated peptidase [Oscillospiraceae bacterium]